jgi:hypothetical protein
VLGAFNTVYAALKSFFARGFWFSTFLPVALFAGLHCLVALIKYGSLSLFGMTLSLNSAPHGISAEALSSIVVVLVAISFVLAPFVNYLRGLLDGSLLPKSLHDWLRLRRYRAARAKKQELEMLFNDLGEVSESESRYFKDDCAIRIARAAAVARLPKTAPNANVVTAAQSALAMLDAGLSSNDTPLGPLATAAEDAIIAAFAQNAPDFDDPASPDDTARSKAIDKAANGLGGKLQDAVLLAKYRYQIAKDRDRVVDAIEFPWATALGDARFVAESYPRKVYNVEFDYLWPRLLMTMKAAKSDDPTLEAIENARTNIDFAALSFFLVMTVPAVWMPVLLARGGPAWLFLVIGAASPLALRFFFGLAFESQLAFASVVSSTIDSSRFSVLNMLRVPEPSSRSEERALWERIANSDELLYAKRESGVMAK